MNGPQALEANVTASMTHYLLAMYCLRRENQPLIGARLAEWLGVAPASVTGMLQRMSRDGLVRMGRGKEIGLTQRGWQIAMATARRHYLAERLLTDLIGLEWSQAHVEAERWQHSITDATEEKLWEALGRPTTCPHGSPIPGTGACFSPHTRRLAASEPGEEVVIESISERAAENIELLRFFEEHELMPGRRLQVQEYSPAAGTLTLRTDRSQVTIGADAATQVLVVPAHLSRERRAPLHLRREAAEAVRSG
ncbi:MAG: metal-dependent transcriptional regulator [Chloroflexota bacterium]|nr:metal-dependent transcriptional regulator [Chloroflexota bacterium]